ncbi:hypothetical protein ACMGDH_06200 [Sphingomonas sp. DT-207]
MTALAILAQAWPGAHLHAEAEALLAPAGKGPLGAEELAALAKHQWLC